MRIGIDLDNTLVEFQRHWANLYRTWFDPDFDVEHAGLGEWDACVQLTHFESVFDMLRWFTRANGWLTQPFIPGAPGVVDRLIADHHLVEFITARPLHAEDQTIRFMAGTPWGSATNTHVLGHSTKSLVRCSVYIDDSPHAIANITGNGKPVLVPAYPWNTEKVLRKEMTVKEIRDHVTWFNSWAEVPALIEEVTS